MRRTKIICTIYLRCRFERGKIFGRTAFVSSRQGSGRGNKPAEIFCYEYHAHYAGVKERLAAGNRRGAFPAEGRNYGNTAGGQCGNCHAENSAGRRFGKRRAMSIWNRAVNLFLSGSALTELLQKGIGCPRIWRLDCRCGQSPGRYGRGENRIPRTEVFRKSGMKKNTDFRLSVMPSVYGETIVIRILSGQMDFIEKNELG